jgi:hypothetical protein
VHGVAHLTPTSYGAVAFYALWEAVETLMAQLVGVGAIESTGILERAMGIEPTSEAP